MQEKLNIQEIICNLVKTNTLSSIIRMHNLYENFVKFLDICGGTGIIEQRTYLKYCNGAETFYSYGHSVADYRTLQSMQVARPSWRMPTVMTW